MNAIAILNKAAIFACKAHAGQFRKDGVTPYSTHPVRVANILAFHCASPIEIICGYWHDILEDLPEKREELLKELTSYNLGMQTNIEILNILEAVCKPTEGNRTLRNKKFVEQIIRGGKSAIMVKICDRIDNVMDSNGLGDFAEEYVVKETGYVIKEFDKLNMNGYVNSAFNTLKAARNEIVEINGWVESE